MMMMMMMMAVMIVAYHLPWLHLSFDALWKRVAAERRVALGNMMMKNGSVCAGVSVFSQRISDGDSGEALSYSLLE